MSQLARLPERPNLDHLKKQAKDLLARYRSGDHDALARFRESLPAAASRDDAAILGMDLRLHDAQSCLAREYGFPSWAELRRAVEAPAPAPGGAASAITAWLRLVYAGDVAGGMQRADPDAAAQALAADPSLIGDDPHLACAIGDLTALRRMTERDRAWLDRRGGPLNLPPLVAVTHSGLVQRPEYRERLHRSARFLLEAGADPDQSVQNLWGADSKEQLCPLSALYGAAGANRDPGLTRLLLEHGADPNDGESLYHSLEEPACTRLLLEAGARIAGTNALFRALDLDDVAPLRLLLAHGADPNEPASNPPIDAFGTPLLWAIRRRRSVSHIEALLAAGADPTVRTPDGIGAHALALRYGLPELADLLRPGSEEASEAECFLAACAAGDEATAQSIQGRRPDLPGTLPETDLQMLPELAALGCGEAVRLMVQLGWPIAMRGGDWNASALNHAVFRGDAGLARFLLAHGAHWSEQHGFGDNVIGTLSWASLNAPDGVGDWVGCAEALLAQGLPAAIPDPEQADGVISDGVRRRFSTAVTRALLGSVQAGSAQSGAQ